MGVQGKELREQGGSGGGTPPLLHGALCAKVCVTAEASVRNKGYSIVRQLHATGGMAFLYSCTGSINFPSYRLANECERLVETR